MSKANRKAFAKQLKDFRRRSYKAIDENPFICQRVTFLQRLCGIKISDAEIWKRKIDYQVLQSLIDYYKG